MKKLKVISLSKILFALIYYVVVGYAVSIHFFIKFATHLSRALYSQIDKSMYSKGVKRFLVKIKGPENCLTMHYNKEAR